MYISEKVKLEFKNLGLHIQNLRKKKNISIKELSEKTGIRKEYLQKIENGTAYGILIERHLVRISKILKVKLSELFEY